MFSIGDKVVYAGHGSGRIVDVEESSRLGRCRDYLVVQIPHNHMTAKIPAASAAKVGLRRVSSATTVNEVFEVLRSTPAVLTLKWHERARFHQTKLNSGDLHDVAEVVRDLTFRATTHELSVSERRMLSTARRIFVSEVMYACDVDEPQATARIDAALAVPKP